MDILNSKYFHFLGIGGIGMSALARYFHEKGCIVSGYDKTTTKLTKKLESEGIAVNYEDDIDCIPQAVLDHPKQSTIVYTPAIPTDSIQLGYFNSKGYSVFKRSFVLGEILNNTKGIAVAGTHGKTTISTMIAHILTHSDYGCNAFLGGISTNYKTNYISSAKSSTTVVEADEFDRSFLTLNPHMAIISSVDADHLDIYENAEELKQTFVEFSHKVIKGGFLLSKQEIELNKIEQASHETYSIIDAEADHYASDIQVIDGTYNFIVKIKNQAPEHYQLGLAGRHNVENALAACVVANRLQIDPEAVGRALKSFQGVSRRFDVHINTKNLVYIDDYAHHPTEIEASVLSVREMFPHRKITAIFQPHLFSRTRDFSDEFARTLDLLDEIVLLPIYPARELPIPGVDSQMLLDKIQNTPSKAVEKSELLSELDEMDLDVLLTLGAGDIDRFVDPIKAKFS